MTKGVPTTGGDRRHAFGLEVSGRRGRYRFMHRIIRWVGSKVCRLFVTLWAVARLLRKSVFGVQIRGNGLPIEFDAERVYRVCHAAGVRSGAARRGQRGKAARASGVRHGHSWNRLGKRESVRRPDFCGAGFAFARWQRVAFVDGLSVPENGWGATSMGGFDAAPRSGGREGRVPLVALDYRPVKSARWQRLVANCRLETAISRRIRDLIRR